MLQLSVEQCVVLCLFDVGGFVVLLVVEIWCDFFVEIVGCSDVDLQFEVGISYWYVVLVLCFIYLFVLVCWVKVDVVWVCGLCDQVIIVVWFNEIGSFNVIVVDLLVLLVVVLLVD